MKTDQQSRLAKILSEITHLHPVLNEWGNRLREKIGEREANERDEDLQISGSYWSLVAYADALTRLRLILEQNFQFGSGCNQVHLRAVGLASCPK